MDSNLYTYKHTHILYVHTQVQMADPEHTAHAAVGSLRLLELHTKYGHAEFRATSSINTLHCTQKLRGTVQITAEQ